MQDIIQSADNPYYKRWRQYASDQRTRSKDSVIWLEGEHLVLEAAKAATIEMLVLPEGAAAPAINCPAKYLSHSLFKSLTSLETPPLMYALVKSNAAQLPAKIAGLNVYLEAVQDAGNVGTIIRLAAAFGAAGVYLSEGCANAFSPKALRAGQGAQFRVNCYENIGLAKLQSLKPQALYVTSLSEKSQPLSALAIEPNCVWAFGNEGAGASEALKNLAMQEVVISEALHFESLNVASAAAICLYAASKIR